MDFECERRRREENFEFLDSLLRYFTYFRTRFEEKLQPQKGIFNSPNFVRLKKYSCKTLYCTRKYVVLNVLPPSWLRH